MRLQLSVFHKLFSAGICLAVGFYTVTPMLALAQNAVPQNASQNSASKTVSPWATRAKRQPRPIRTFSWKPAASQASVHATKPETSSVSSSSVNSSKNAQQQQTYTIGLVLPEGLPETDNAFKASIKALEQILSAQKISFVEITPDIKPPASFPSTAQNWVFLPTRMNYVAERVLQAGMNKTQQVVLFPAATRPDWGGLKVLRQMGVRTSGSTTTVRPIALQYKPSSIKLGIELPAQSRFIMMQASGLGSITPAKPLIFWEGLYPAAMTSEKGVVLSISLEQLLNIPGLKQSLLEPLINLAVSTATATTVANKTNISSVDTVLNQAIQAIALHDAAPQSSEPEKAFSQKAQGAPQATLLDPVASAREDYMSTVATEMADISIQNTPLQEETSSREENASANDPNNPSHQPSNQPSSSEAEPSAVSVEKPPQIASTTPASNSSTLPVTQPATATTPAVPAHTENKLPKKENINDPSQDDADLAASILGTDGGPPPEPELDYGIYLDHMHQLYDLKDQLRRTVSLAKELPTVQVSETTVDELIRKANRQQNQFESLFVAGKLDDAQAAYDEAARYLLEAMFLALPPTPAEGRALWLDRGTIVEAGSPEKLKALIGQLHDAGFNILYFETVNAGFPIYPSKILPPNPLVKGWDPLKVAVDEGHRLGMEVHAWVWCFAVGNIRHNKLIGLPDSYPGPVLDSSGGGVGLMSEAMHRADGGLRPFGQNEYWLSPASPKARQFLLSVYSEIVKNYAVDGLQLDYIRYPFQKPGALMGYESMGRSGFQADSGITFNGLQDYGLKTWVAWKTFQVNQFVKEVSQGLRAINPNIKLSAAVFPLQRASRIAAIQQDWETWLNNGWIDTLSPMIYTSSPERLGRVYESIVNSTKKRPIVYPGIALNRLQPAKLLNELLTLREKGALGVTMFAAAHLTPGKMEALGQGAFKNKDTIIPHQTPHKALASMVEDYQTMLNALALNPSATQQAQQAMVAKQAATQMIAEAGGAVAPLPNTAPPSEDTLKNLQSLLDQLHRLSQSPESDQDFRQTFLSFQKQADNWLDGERQTYPARSLYFTQLLRRIYSLLDYSDKTPDRTTDQATDRTTVTKPASKASSSEAAPTIR